MAYTTPITWSEDQELTANTYNQQIRDNISYLFARPFSSSIQTLSGLYTNSSTSFLAVDAAKLSVTLSVSTGARAVVMASVPGSGSGNFRIANTTTGITVPCGSINFSVETAAIPVFAVFTGLSGTNTFQLQYQANSGGTITVGRSSPNTFAVMMAWEI